MRPPQHGQRSREWPVRGRSRSREPAPGGERCRGAEAREAAEELQVLIIERRMEQGEEEPTIETREDFDRKKEAGATTDPARGVGRRSAARHHGVDMGMMMEVLSPSMEHGDETDLGAEMLGIGGDDAPRLGGPVEQS